MDMIANRILELTKEAGFYVYDGKVFPVKSSESQTEFIEKFAKLLIQETLEVVRDEVQYALGDYLADTIDLRVKTYFGVEE